MKRLTPAYQQLLILRSRREMGRRNLRSKPKDRSRAVAEHIIPIKRESYREISLYRDGIYYPAKVVNDPTPAPEHLSLSKNYDETAIFLSEIRGRFQDFFKANLIINNRKVRRRVEAGAAVLSGYYDFTTIRNISASTALMLASEYDCVLRSGGLLPGAVDFDAWDPSVRAMLDGIGFLDMVGIHGQSPAIVQGDQWRLLRFRSGDEADGEQVNGLLEELGVAEALENGDLYGAIVEALVNTRQHAYPSGQDYRKPHFAGWWLTGFVDEQSRHVRINALDHGLSIPGTLPDWERYPRYQRGWKRLFRDEPDPSDTSRDGNAIALAMAVGRSSTKKGFRGRGLPAIESTLDLCRDGQLTIYSRCGEYRSAKGQRPTLINRTVPIGGTLITWDLRF